jgi:hypothetical protein
MARYKTISVRLHAPAGRTDQSLDPEAPVGCIPCWRTPDLVMLGSVGFPDRWTVTVSRFAQAIAVEDRDAFDARFGVVLPILRRLPTPLSAGTASGELSEDQCCGRFVTEAAIRGTGLS